MRGAHGQRHIDLSLRAHCFQKYGDGNMDGMRTVALSILLLTLTAGAAVAQSSSRPMQFLNTASQINNAEIALGKFILQKSNNQVARGYAQKMIQDHSANQSKLQALAAKERVSLTTTLPPAATQELGQLSKWSGNQLAATYIAHEISDHRQAIAVFQQAQNDFPAQPISTYIGKTLPMLNEHLQLALADSPKIP
jgi:putative membrane protein